VLECKSSCLPDPRG